MKKYAQIDTNGNPIAFYSDNIHGNIPVDAIEIPEEDWQAHINGRRKVYQNGTWVDYVPSDAELLAQAKAKKIAEIEHAYKNAISADIDFNGHTFQADTKSQDILTKVIASAPAGFSTNWLDTKNKPVPMTLDDLKGLAGAILQRGQQAFLHRVDLKNQVTAATTVADVEAINW